jgi:hypothetical protein
MPNKPSPPARRPHAPTPLRPVGAALVIDEAPSTAGEDDLIVARADGYYWVAVDGRQEFGPFKSAEAARQDRDQLDDQAPAPGESLAEAESEIGIADWIDPETGGLADGPQSPHLPDE